jgi:gluconokinase
VLALDVGSSSVRAQRFDDRAEPLDDLRRERYEGQDPDEIVALVRAVVRGRDAGVDAVGASCFAHSLVALDAAGRPLTPVLGWRDTRPAAAAEWLRRRVPDPASLYARTGAPLHPSFWPAKLAWLAEAEPEIFRRSARFVSFCDYLYAELLGVEPATSISIASGTGLLDLATRAWDPELLEILGVGEERLPPVSDEPHGTWYPAWIDGACSNLGAGSTATPNGSRSWPTLSAGR